jgi:2-methylisocitrate lyase-like PEP mutase family enzyme
LAGGSVEDYTGDPAKPIYEFNLAVERVQAAAEAVEAAGGGFVLTARAENLLRGVNDLDDTIRRLQAYEAAGAEVLYAPILTTLDQVRTVTGAVGKPVNVLAPSVRGATVAQLAEAGAKRLSVGGALARAALTAMLNAGTEMRDHGTFGWTGGLATMDEVSALLNLGIGS